ncbi:uncharacterized protein G2W53_015793 [Senna tora]|uniref:Uncharacterized protein n=1 Tax=Senna tora TaxID=362788 RepID=A0A835C8B7_9FABA|nr:uncharacterized protein G2W53_015793 [Senna tora]
MGYPLWLILGLEVEGFPSFYEPPPSVKDVVLGEARVAVKSRDPERKLRSLREVVPQPYEMLVATLGRKFLFAPSSYYIAILQNLKDGGLNFSSYMNLEDKVVLKGGGNVMSTSRPN